MHKFIVSAHDNFNFVIYRMCYRNLASTNADNETVCTILLTSQVVMVHSLQPKGHPFEVSYSVNFLPSFKSTFDDKL